MKAIILCGGGGTRLWPESTPKQPKQFLKIHSDNSLLAETVLRFEVMTLHLLGFLPNLETCVICGQPAAPADRVLFGHEAAGVLCGTCRPGQQQVASLSRGVLEALRQASEPETEGSLATLDRRLWGELRGLLHRYLTNLLGRPPRMHKYLAPLMAPSS